MDWRTLGRVRRKGALHKRQAVSSSDLSHERLQRSWERGGCLSPGKGDAYGYI